ncbi:MAG: hypothetical protein K8S16_00675 [Bacteroidales bacterium]|nr:hypothetical protein [Bacteroidales bacterium]
MEQNIEQKGTGRMLRQKLINLMYLIFIVLAFLYIPSNFIDVFKDLNSTFEKSATEFDNSFSVSQLNNLYNFNSLLFNYLTQSPDINVQKVKSNFESITQDADSVIQKIERIKKLLVMEAGGFNEYGYLKNSKNYKATEYIFFEQNMADTLLGYLLSFKNNIRPKVSEKCYEKADRIIETKEYIEASSGEPKAWSNYYFNKMPVSGSITVLSKFQNDIRKAGNTVIESYISFLTGSSDSLLIDVYNRDFNDIRAFVTKDGRIDSLTLDSAGRIKFFPYEEGKYLFTIYDNIRKVEKTFIVKDIGPVVQQPELPVLYAGIDNPINVDHPEFTFRKLKVVTTLGSVIRKSGEFYLRMKSQGVTTVKVFGIAKSGEKLLATQRFVVEDLPDLKVSLAGHPKKSISVSKLRDQNQLLVSSELAQGENFIVKEFRVKRIHKQSFKNIIDVETNSGASFNSETKSILGKAEPGDMYIFENIVVISLNKKLMEVPPIVLTVN